MPRQKIIPFLWYDDQAEEAANFYTFVFKHSKMGSITRFGKAGPRPEGMVLTVSFEIGGQEFVALNGGPEFKFSEAISFQIPCESQEEVDYFWDTLSEGGEEGVCGWLKDRFGMSWQVTPTVLPEMLSDPDPEKARRAMQALLQMKKIDIDTLKRAYEGRSKK